MEKTYALGALGTGIQCMGFENNKAKTNDNFDTGNIRSICGNLNIVHLSRRAE